MEKKPTHHLNQALAGETSALDLGHPGTVAKAREDMRKLEEHNANMEFHRKVRENFKKYPVAARSAFICLLCGALVGDKVHHQRFHDHVSSQDF